MAGVANETVIIRDLSKGKLQKVATATAIGHRATISRLPAELCFNDARKDIIPPVTFEFLLRGVSEKDQEYMRRFCGKDHDRLNRKAQLDDGSVIFVTRLSSGGDFVCKWLAPITRVPSATLAPSAALAPSATLAPPGTFAVPHVPAGAVQGEGEMEWSVDAHQHAASAYDAAGRGRSTWQIRGGMGGDMGGMKDNGGEEGAPAAGPVPPIPTPRKRSATHCCGGEPSERDDESEDESKVSTRGSLSLEAVQAVQATDEQCAVNLDEHCVHASAASAAAHEASEAALTVSAMGARKEAREAKRQREAEAAPPPPCRHALDPARPKACDDGDDTNLDDIDDDDAVAVAAQAAQAAQATEAEAEAESESAKVFRFDAGGCRIRSSQHGGKPGESRPFWVDDSQPIHSQPMLGLYPMLPRTPSMLPRTPSDVLIRVLSGLDDRLDEALLGCDIKLLRVSWLLRQPERWRLKPRQELEAMADESPFLSAEEAVALLRRGNRGVGALTQGWLSPGDCDPDGVRIDVVRAALAQHPHIEGLFWDYASLFQNLPDRERTPVERAAFGRAIMVMADVYASAVGTTVLQSREIPPRPESFHGALCLFGLKPMAREAAVHEAFGGFGTIVALELMRNPPVVRFASHEAALAAKRAGPWAELCDGVDTLYNERPYDERGWCVFENAVSYELLARLGAVPRVRAVLDALPSKVLVLQSGLPTQRGDAPAGELADRVDQVIARIAKATFTGNSDSETVPALYRDYVARIVGVVQSVLALASEVTVGSQVALPPMPAAAGEECSTAVEPTVETAAGQLPRGWGSAKDPASGNTYYFLPAGETQWEVPTSAVDEEDVASIHAWHLDCLRAHHAHIPDALSGRLLNTLTECVPIGVEGYDANGRPLAVRDARSLCAWLNGIHASARPCMLLTAGPAAGKTWLMSQLIMHSIDGDLLPILVEVQRLQKALAEHEAAFAAAPDWVDAYLRLTCAPDHYGLLRAAMDARRALLLLDGLDEAGRERARIEAHVATVLAPRKLVLLCTSRPTGLDEALFQGFHRLKLAPLSDAQQAAFLATRLTPTRAGALVPYLRERVPLDAETRLRVTCNPLMLSMVTSIAVLRADIAMPTRTAELYDVAARAMLARGGALPEADMALLQATFFEAHAAQQRVITAAHLDAAARQLGCGAEALRARVLQDRLPLLRVLQEAPLQMQAFHLSFQEFYAMRALADGSGRALANFRVGDPWWTNAVLMGVQEGDAFGERFVEAAGLGGAASEGWRARLVTALAHAGLPGAWLPIVAEAASAPAEYAKLKRFVGRNRDVLQREGGKAVAQLALQQPQTSVVLDALKSVPLQRLIVWLNKPQVDDPCIATFAHEGVVKSVGVSTTRIVGGAGKVVYVYDADTEELLKWLECTSGVHSVAVFEGDKLGWIAAGFENGTISVWDSATLDLKTEKTKAHSDAVESVVFSLDGTKIVSGSRDKRIRVWDSATLGLKIEKMDAHSSWIRSVAFSPDGTKIVSGSNDKAIRLWDADTLELEEQMKNAHNSNINSVAFSPDGTKICSASGNMITPGTIRVWDAVTLDLQAEKSGADPYAVRSVQFSPDGTKIVSGGDAGTIRLWNAATLELKSEKDNAHDCPVSSVGFSENGSKIVSASGAIYGSGTNTIKVFDAATLDQLKREKVNAHNRAISSVDFNHDGTLIVSACYGGTIRVWDAATLDLKAEKLNGHSNRILSVKFSPDGRKIVSGSSDRTIVWDADSFDLIESRPRDVTALSTEALGVVLGVVRDGATVRIKDGGGAFYAPSPILCIAVSWPRVAAGAQSGELYHLKVI